MDRKMNAMGGPVMKGLSRASLMWYTSDPNPQDTYTVPELTSQDTNTVSNLTSQVTNLNPQSAARYEISSSYSRCSKWLDEGIPFQSMWGDLSNPGGEYPHLPTTDPLMLAFRETEADRINAAARKKAINPPTSSAHNVNPAILANMPNAHQIQVMGMDVQHGSDYDEIVRQTNSDLLPMNSLFSGNGTSIEVTPKLVPPYMRKTVIYEKEIYSRKVFIGGLPFDMSKEAVMTIFQRFGRMMVDWPFRNHANNPSINPGDHLKGYVFIVYEQERSVQQLVNECHTDGENHFVLVSSPTMHNKPVQVRPWRLEDTYFKKLPEAAFDPRLTVFIGGLPRPTTAVDLARELEHLYGEVSLSGIDIDPELMYPRGAARVMFSNKEAFMNAIAGRFVRVPCGSISRRVEMKPYVVDEQVCEKCCGTLCDFQYAKFLCGHIDCLKYYCNACWSVVHPNYFTSPFCPHKPVQKAGNTNQPTALSCTDLRAAQLWILLNRFVV